MAVAAHRLLGYAHVYINGGVEEDAYAQLGKGRLWAFQKERGKRLLLFLAIDIENEALLDAAFSAFLVRMGASRDDVEPFMEKNRYWQSFMGLN